MTDAEFGGAAEAVAPDLADWPDLDDPLPTPSHMLDLHLLHLPVAVYLAAEQHHDALLREFAFLAEQSSVADVPRRLLEVAEELHRRFGTATFPLRAQVQQAADRGEETVDLEMRVATESIPYLLRMNEQLREADRYCEEGDLLTLASPPEVRRFRDWYTGQVEQQSTGSPPEPWPAEWT